MDCPAGLIVGAINDARVLDDDYALGSYDDSIGIALRLTGR